MFLLYSKDEGAGKGILGHYTTFRKLMDAAKSFVESQQPRYDEGWYAWYELIATETAVDAPATRCSHYFQFDKHGAVTKRSIWRIATDDDDDDDDASL